MTACAIDRHQGPACRDRAAIWTDCLHRIVQGDAAAMATLYDETKTMVFSLAYRVLGNRHDAEETTLDVYLQVWRTSARYDARRGTVAAWLLMMARSRAVDRLRDRGQAAAAPSIELEDGLPSEDPNPEEASVAGAERARVRAALCVLSREQRLAIELVFFGGLTHRELAERLGEPLGTVKTRVRAALQRLRAALLDPAPTRFRAALPARRIESAASMRVETDGCSRVAC